MMRPSSEDKTSPKSLVPAMGSTLGVAPTEQSKSRPSGYLMKSSQVSRPNEPPCVMPFVTSQPHLKRTLHSCWNSGLRPTIDMEDVWRNPMLLGHEQSPGGIRDQTAPPSNQTLLERMRLGNQTLLARLGLPLKTLSSPSQAMYCPSNLGLKDRVGSSNELLMTREMTEVTMLGTGISQEVVHPGKTLMRETYPPRGKPTFCRMSTSPTLSMPSKTSSCSKAAPNSPELLLMTMSSTSEITSNFQQRGQGSLKPR